MIKRKNLYKKKTVEIKLRVPRLIKCGRISLLLKKKEIKIDAVAIGLLYEENVAAIEILYGSLKLILYINSR